MGEKDDGSGLGLSLSLGLGMNTSSSLKESLMQKKPSFRTLPNQRASWSDIFQLPADRSCEARTLLRGVDVNFPCFVMLLTMPSSCALFLCLINICLLASLSSAVNATISYNFEVSYITASPLGVPQQVIAINKLFPGPTINSTTNNNVVINVRNRLDEDLLIHCALILLSQGDRDSVAKAFGRSRTSNYVRIQDSAEMVARTPPKSKKMSAALNPLLVRETLNKSLPLSPHNFQDLFDSVDAFLFDCDGVIWKGNKLIDGVSQTLDMLQAKGKKLVFVTNNSLKSRKQNAKKFQSLAISVSEEEIFSSSFAAAMYLKTNDFPKEKKDIAMIRARLGELEIKFGLKPVVVVTEKDYDRDPEILKQLDPFKVFVLCSKLKVVPYCNSSEESFKKFLMDQLKLKFPAAN